MKSMVVLGVKSNKDRPNNKGFLSQENVLSGYHFFYILPRMLSAEIKADVSSENDFD